MKDSEITKTLLGVGCDNLVRRCESCRGDLIRKPYCPPCEGAGFFGAPMDEMENACSRCNGTGEPQPGEDFVWRWTCENCGLIYPTNVKGESPPPESDGEKQK